MLKGHLTRVIYHQVYLYTIINVGGSEFEARELELGLSTDPPPSEEGTT